MSHKIVVAHKLAGGSHRALSITSTRSEREMEAEEVVMGNGSKSEIK